MQFFIAVTDNNWYHFLSKNNPDEVNFWRPSGKTFKSINIGTPFLFKLHSPINYIVGGGFFIRSERLSLSLAWEAFKIKNGTNNQKELRLLIQKYRGDKEFDPYIGCTILNEPFFLPKELWIPIPKDWAPNIVSGKTYDTNNNIGEKLWYNLNIQLSKMKKNNIIKDEINPYQVNRYGQEYLNKCRLGQGAFRLLVTNAYQKSCSITGKKTLPALEAAHIKPFSEEGPNKVDNGLLLRSDLHKLFDKGYITITTNYEILISKKIKEEFENGRHYYPYHGNRLLVIPESLYDKPNKAYLQWHNEQIYRG